MEHPLLLGPDVIALKLVVHQFVMHSANTDNKKLHSSHTFFKTVLCPPCGSHWKGLQHTFCLTSLTLAETLVKFHFLLVTVRDLQEGKQHCFMFITATSLWTKQCSLYAALTKMLVHSPLINAVQARVEQLSRSEVNKTPAGKPTSVSWLAHFNKSMR